MFKRIAAIGVAVATLVVGFGRFDTVSASTFVQCHDDSAMPQHAGHWTHGDPNVGLPGDKRGGNGYYYLSITAGCGEPKGSEVTLVGHVKLVAIVSGTIDDTMCWRLDISPGYDHSNRLASALLMGGDVRLVFTHAIAGQKYRLRIANMEPGVTVTDLGSFDG